MSEQVHLIAFKSITNLNPALVDKADNTVKFCLPRRIKCRIRKTRGKMRDKRLHGNGEEKLCSLWVLFANKRIIRLPRYMKVGDTVSIQSLRVTNFVFTMTTILYAPLIFSFASFPTFVEISFPCRWKLWVYSAKRNTLLPNVRGKTSWLPEKVFVVDTSRYTREVTFIKIWKQSS